MILNPNPHPTLTLILTDNLSLTLTSHPDWPSPPILAFTSNYNWMKDLERRLEVFEVVDTPSPPGYM